MLIEITQNNYGSPYYSYTWTENTVKIVHNMNGAIICQIYDNDNKLVYMDVQVIDDNTLSITFPLNWMPKDDYTYSAIIMSAKSSTGVVSPSDNTWTFEYYAGTVADVMLFCKSLKIGNGKLSQITDKMVQKYMELINGNIDSMLEECYFVPVKRYNRVNPDGTITKVFPGKIRMLALQWTAGLLLQSEFQNLQPNQTESVSKYIEQSRKQIYELSKLNMHIPGLRWKANHISHFALPELMPSRDVQRLD